MGQITHKARHGKTHSSIKGTFVRTSSVMGPHSLRSTWYDWYDGSAPGTSGSYQGAPGLVSKHEHRQAVLFGIAPSYYPGDESSSSYG